MINLNSLYVCPEHFTFKCQGDTCNITPFGAIITINIKDRNMRLYNGDTLELEVSYNHPDVKPLYNTFEDKSEIVFQYDSYKNRQKRSYDRKKLAQLKREVDKTRAKYMNRLEVVCRREMRSLVKQLDEYTLKVDGIK